MHVAFPEREQVVRKAVGSLALSGGETGKVQSDLRNRSGEER